MGKENGMPSALKSLLSQVVLWPNGSSLLLGAYVFSDTAFWCLISKNPSVPHFAQYQPQGRSLV